MPKKVEYVKYFIIFNMFNMLLFSLKNYERKIKSLFIIYADVESVLAPDNNGKQKAEEFYANKYQKHIAFSYGFKLVCVNDKSSKPFKTYLGKDAVYNSMIEERKYCSSMIKKHFNKELMITKTMKILRTLLNVRFVIMIILIMMLK